MNFRDHSVGFRSIVLELGNNGVGFKSSGMSFGNGDTSFGNSGVSFGNSDMCTYGKFGLGILSQQFLCSTQRWWNAR